MMKSWYLSDISTFKQTHFSAIVDTGATPEHCTSGLKRLVKICMHVGNMLVLRNFAFASFSHGAVFCLHS